MEDVFMRAKPSFLKIPGLILVLCIPVVFCFSISLGSASQVQELEINPRTIQPTNGEAARISFQIPAKAEATVKIYDPSHFLMTALLENRVFEPGRHTVLWNGRDAAGRLVPDEAYYCTIDLSYADGRHASFNPASSGGVYLGVIPARLVKESGTVSYSLSEPARIRIRAGVTNGPLYKTLLDWAPRTAGEQVLAWDGLDRSSSLSIWKKDDFVISASAFSLPPKSIIVTGTGISYIEYWTSRAREAGMGLFEYLRTSAPAREARLRAREINQNVLSRSDVEISEYYLMNRFSNQPPMVSMKLGNGGQAEEGTIPRVSGSLQVMIEFSELTRQRLLEQRYEIILYVDDVMVLEDESGYTPYTWILDSSTLENGEHVLTVNIATLSDQVGTFSQKVVVDN